MPDPIFTIEEAFGKPNRRKPPTRTYKSWQSMKDRCFNPKATKFPIYGALGIIVCDRWKNSFKNFLEDMGERPNRTTLDRYPNQKGNYEPGNCRWATGEQQSQNRPGLRIVTFRGKTACLAAISREFGIDCEMVRNRLRKGWTIEDALNTPKIMAKSHKVKAILV